MPPAPEPRTLALQVKSKTLNFKFRIPHNLLPAARFSFILKFRRCRLIFKSAPTNTHTHWLRSKLCRIINPSPKPKPKPQTKLSKSEPPLLSVILQLFLSQGLQKGAVSLFLYFVNKLLVAHWTLSKLLSVLIVCVLSGWASLNLCHLDDSLLSYVWWVVSNVIPSVGLEEVISMISAVIGRIEEPAFLFL